MVLEANGFESVTENILDLVIDPLSVNRFRHPIKILLRIVRLTLFDIFLIIDATYVK